jgi:predicted membrane channel-forming protein YqfA (hemolysin III family)
MSSFFTNADPSKADSTGIVVLYVFIGIAILGMVFTSYAPAMKDLTILLVALIFLSLGIWYLVYSVQLYKKSKLDDGGLLSRVYDRLLTAIGN